MSQDALVVVYVSMHTFGLLGSLLLLLTVMFSSNIFRHLTWLNLNFSWIIACFVAALLFISGQLFKDTPDPSVCLVQASAMQATSSLTAGTTLAFVVHLWIEIILRPVKGVESSLNTRGMLAFGPFIFPFAYFLAAFIMGISSPSSVVLHPSKMFCVNTTPALSIASTVYGGLMMVPTLGLSCVISVSVYRFWRTYPRESRHVALARTIRISVFTFFSFIAVVINFVAAAEAPWGATGTPSIIVGMTPIAYVLVFGTQKDVLLAWTFWRKSDNAPPSYPSVKMEMV